MSIQCNKCGRYKMRDDPFQEICGCDELPVSTYANNDPMEKWFAKICQRLNIEAVPHDHISGLDFYLPAYDAYVEVKQFHSDRISEQMSRRDGVIAIQGQKGLTAFENMINGADEEQYVLLDAMFQFIKTMMSSTKEEVAGERKDLMSRYHRVRKLHIFDERKQA